MTFTGHLALNTNKLTRRFDQDSHTTSELHHDTIAGFPGSNAKTLVSLSKVRAGKVNWYSGRKRTDHQTSVGLWECLIVSRGGPVGREWGVTEGRGGRGCADCFSSSSNLPQCTVTSSATHFHFPGRSKQCAPRHSL